MSDHTASLTTPRPAPRRLGRVLLALSLVALGSFLPGLPTAQAAPAGWATFEPLSGASRDFTSVMQQRPTGFPAAVVRTNSVGGSAVGVQSGASAFLAPNTPVGELYGSSQGRPYLNLRPNGLNAAPPSVTTYTFARPTPATGWTFVLGDIDADQVTITATGAEDQPVSADQLGFQSTFNYCAPGVSPKPSCGPPGNDGRDKPNWDPDSATLTGNGPDTAGASAWFEPTVALTSLTFSYAQRSGSPVYQTWFSARSYDLGGTVKRSDETDQPISGVKLNLYDPYGALIGSTRSADDGSYSFPDLASYDGYRVEVERPSGLTSDALERTVDLSRGNLAAEDFSLRAFVPSAVKGTVTDRETNLPVEGVTVQLDGPQDYHRTATTLADGGYLFDQVPVGVGYEVTVDVPDGFLDDPTTRTFDVPAESETPISGQDFELIKEPTGTIGGTVLDTHGDAVADVLITITGPGDQTYQVRTDQDGSYALAGLRPGPYAIGVTAPDGDEVVGDDSLAVTIPPTGGDFIHRDFEIRAPEPAPTYAISGTIVDPAGDPVPDAVVSAEPSDGGVPLTTTTDEHGTFTVPGLPADVWQISVVPPSDYQAPDSQEVTITDASQHGISFTVTPKATAPPTTAPPTTAPPTSAPPTTAPPTTTPPTSAPPTTAPPTSAPPTTAPPTTAPPTSAPPTSAPPTTAPPSSSSPTAGASTVQAVSSTSLADTGGPSAVPLVIGLGAVVAGSSCLLAARRRRARRH